MSSITALTRLPSPLMDGAVRTFVAHEPIDVAKVNLQHASYRAALAAAGASVVVIDADAESPDCVFIEDTAIVLDELAILCSMGALSRRNEPAAVEPALAKLRKVVRVELPATIDGGDVIVTGRTILVGQSGRTNAAALSALADIARPLGYDVRAVAVTGCLHLKTACTALPDGRLLANPRFFRDDALPGFERVNVDAESANVVCVGETVCIGAAYAETADRLEREGFAVTRIDLSELAKADGCATCLSLLLRG